MSAVPVALFLLVAVISIALSPVLGAPPLGFLPNIIIFYGDDFGWGDLQSYGHPISLTPNIDQLVAQGTKFTDFYSTSPVCSPSRAGLLTGRFQTRSGVYPGVFWPDSVGGMPLSEITIAEVLKSNGLNYSTAHIGKWHLGTGGVDGTYLPTRQGFDFYTGIPYSQDMPNPPYCFPGGLGCWPATPIDPWNSSCPDSMAADATTHPSNAWMKDYDLTAYYEYQGLLEKYSDYFANLRLPSSDPQKKRFTNDYQRSVERADEYMFVPHEVRLSDDKPYEELGLADPALPLYWNEDIVQQPVNITMIPQWYTNACKSFIQQSVSNAQPFFLYMAFHQTHHPDFSSTQFFNTSQRGMIGDSIREMDWNIGNLMEYLTALNVHEHTFVFFSSDNGPSLMRLTRGGNAGPLKCGKGTTYEGGQRQPGIAWMPKYIQAGRVTRGMGSTLDILPTIAELVDVPLVDDRYYDGVSMFDWLFNDGTSARNTFFYWPKDPRPSLGWQKSLHAVRINQWKLHWITGGSHCPNTYADHDCRGNASETILTTPLLFNLYQDCAEMYPIGNLGTSFYAPVVAEVNQSWSEIFATPGLFGDSEMGKGQNTTFGPCCHWGCTPWPGCCNCDKINSTALFDAFFQ